MIALDDTTAVRRFVQNRSEEAFRQLYRTHTPFLWALALRLSGGRTSEAEDVLQEAWVRAAERLADFRGGSALRTWLAGILLNCCREQRRRQRTDSSALPPEPTVWPSAPDQIDLERRLAALPEGQRDVVLLHHVQGFTHEEVAILLDIAPGTSKSRLFEARRTLRQQLETPARDRSASTTRDKP